MNISEAELKKIIAEEVELIKETEGMSYPPEVSIILETLKVIAPQALKSVLESVNKKETKWCHTLFRALLTKELVK